MSSQGLHSGVGGGDHLGTAQLLKAYQPISKNQMHMRCLGVTVLCLLLGVLPVVFGIIYWCKQIAELNHKLQKYELLKEQQQKGLPIEALRMFIWRSEEGLSLEEQEARGVAYERLTEGVFDGSGQLNPDWPGCVETLGLSGLRICSLPASIGVFTGLKILSLCNTNIRVLPPEIGNLVALECLYLDDTPLAALPPEIGHLVNLQWLELNNTKLEALPAEIGNLVALDCLSLNDTPLAALPPEIGHLVNLQWLALTNTNLVALPPEIGRLHHLSNLYLGRTNLSVLPQQFCCLSNLRILCLGGTNITELPGDIWSLSSLRDLNLCGLIRLRALPPGISGLQRLERLDIRLTMIADSPDLQALRNRARFEMRENRRDPVRPNTSAATSYIANEMPRVPSAPAQIHISRADMRENPKSVLNLVVQTLQSLPPDLKVTFLGEPGIDAGGLRKSLWSDLGRTLFGENDPTKLPAEKSADGGWMPTVRDGHTAADSENLVKLGRMISWGASRSDHKLLLAPVFSPDLFVGLHAHISQQEPLVVLRMLLHDQSLALLDKSDWSDEEWPVIEALADMHLELPENNRRAHVAEHLNELQEAILADPRSKAHLTMIKALAEGLEQGALGERESLRALSPAQIQERYQGRLDADRFKAALACHEHKRLSDLQVRSAQEEERLKLLTARLEWLGNWIINPLGELEAPTVEQQAACQQMRQRLLHEITGRETLLDEENVFLLIVGNNTPPSFHTCYSRLDMPQDIATEEDFRVALTNLTAVLDEGYNRG